MRLGYKFHLDSAHQVPTVPKCARLHGHTYEVEVRIEGDIGADGMILEFGAFKERAWREVLSRYDHAYLNEVMTVVPTVENITRVLHEELVRVFPGFVLSLRVFEGHGKYAEHP
jgi:6-pyruvoyltetrahydropterin/6-carboxytetrahydropterin synthase